MPRKSATDRAPPTIGARVECLHHPNWYAGSVVKLMSGKGKKKPVTQMHVVFDDGDEADWNLNNSMPWRYEKKVSGARNPRKPAFASLGY